VDDLKFWEIVQIAHDQSSGDMDEKCNFIRGTLSALPKDEAIAFARIFDSQMDIAYSWPLWGAAFIVNGGCGDDTFSDFRAALISRGHSAFKNAVSNPDSLADDEYYEDQWFYEGYQYSVLEGVKAAAGFLINRDNPSPDQPSGKEWTEAEVYNLYPKLSSKFG
jgi:Protein of unknown function (DUF4240)